MEQKLQEQIIGYLAEAFGATTQEELQQGLTQAGIENEDQLRQLMEIAYQAMQQGVDPQDFLAQLQSARKGAKLEYIKTLRAYKARAHKAGGCVGCKQGYKMEKPNTKGSTLRIRKRNWQSKNKK